jgi:hypothetical protein
MKTTRSADLAREVHLVRDHQQRHALVGQALHHLQHLAHQLGVQRRGDLVAQQHAGLHRQRAGDRHALLLAAESWSGQASNFSARPTRSAARAPAPRPRRPVTLLDQRGRQHHVAAHAQVRETG